MQLGKLYKYNGNKFGKGNNYVLINISEKTGFCTFIHVHPNNFLGTHHLFLEEHELHEMEEIEWE